jgi:hypothetical protein
VLGLLAGRSKYRREESEVAKRSPDLSPPHVVSEIPILLVSLSGTWTNLEGPSSVVSSLLQHVDACCILLLYLTFCVSVCMLVMHACMDIDVTFMHAYCINLHTNIYLIGRIKDEFYFPTVNYLQLIINIV